MKALFALLVDMAEYGRAKGPSHSIQSFHSASMEQQSWDVVTITFYLHGDLEIVEINIDRYRLPFLTTLSLSSEN